MCTYVCVCVHLSPSAVDLVRMTVCMTRLLVKEKLKQFSDLCFRAEVCVQWGKGPGGGGFTQYVRSTHNYVYQVV